MRYMNVMYYKYQNTVFQQMAIFHYCQICIFNSIEMFKKILTFKSNNNSGYHLATCMCTCIVYTKALRRFHVKKACFIRVKILIIL